MSFKKFVPQIAENLDFTAVGLYLAKCEIITIEECSSYHQQLLSGNSTNGDVMHKILPKINQNPRQFYRALRESVSDKGKSIHTGNKALFEQLPQDFGKKKILRTFQKMVSFKGKQMPTLEETPSQESSGTDECIGRQVVGCDESDSDLDEIFSASHPGAGWPLQRHSSMSHIDAVRKRSKNYKTKYGSTKSLPEKKDLDMKSLESKFDAPEGSNDAYAILCETLKVESQLCDAIKSVTDQNKEKDKQLAAQVIEMHQKQHEREKVLIEMEKLAAQHEVQLLKLKIEMKELYEKELEEQKNARKDLEVQLRMQNDKVKDREIKIQKLVQNNEEQHQMIEGLVDRQQKAIYQVEHKQAPKDCDVASNTDKQDNNGLSDHQSGGRSDENYETTQEAVGFFGKVKSLLKSQHQLDAEMWKRKYLECRQADNFGMKNMADQCKQLEKENNDLKTQLSEAQNEIIKLKAKKLQHYNLQEFSGLTTPSTSHLMNENQETAFTNDKITTEDFYVTEPLEEVADS